MASADADVKRKQASVGNAATNQTVTDSWRGAFKRAAYRRENPLPSSKALRNSADGTVPAKTRRVRADNWSGNMQLWAGIHAARRQACTRGNPQ